MNLLNQLSVLLLVGRALHWHSEGHGFFPSGTLAFSVLACDIVNIIHLPQNGVSCKANKLCSEETFGR